MTLQEYMNRHLPTGERLARLRQVIEASAAMGDATNSDEIEKMVDQSCDLFDAIQPEVEGAELKAVALLMIEEAIDQLRVGSLMTALTFDRIPLED